MRFAFIQRHRREFSVRRMCGILEVSPSGYYAWLGRPESRRRREDRRLKSKMEGEFRISRKAYGSRRLGRAVGCGRTRARRLMRESGLVAKKTRQFRVSTTNSDHGLPVAENLLDQDFTAEAPDRVWAGDITQIRTREGWLYLTVLIDLYSRRIVGWATSSSLETSLCRRALERAVETRRPEPGLVHHSDRGSQYASTEYQAQLAELRFRCSMSGVGNCFDNAVVESFFDTLKTEVWDRPFETRREAHEAVLYYIEGFYNLKRQHSTLGYVSPAVFERAA